MTIVEIISRIKEGNTSHHPILIAVDGFGGAGKTTFADKLKHALQDAYVIHIDDFIIKEKFAYLSWDNGTFDRKRLRKEVLQPVAQGKTVEYRKFICAEDKLSEPVKVVRPQYLIVEGITSFHPDIADFFDYKIWIDTPIEVAKERGKQRDRSIGNQFDDLWELWAKNDLEYESRYRPQRNADFTLTGT